MNEHMIELERQISSLQEQVQQLREELLSNKKEHEILAQTIRDMYQVNNQVMMSVSKIMGDQMLLNVEQGFVKARCANLPYELLDPRFKREEYDFPIIRGVDETIEEIIQNKKSIARFGDGEFAQIAQEKRHKFQRLDEKLGIRLEEVLYSNHPDVLIAIANNYGTLQDYTQKAADEIREYMMEDGARERHMELLEKGRVYYDAYMSRPYVMFKDNMTDAPAKRFEHLKKIWENRSVIIVEGAQTRMGVRNNLLDGAKDIKRILAPATSSFDRYDDILKAALEHAKRDTLFLIAMGPSGGVLAYDLAVEGYQALDIGHLDLEYEWFLAGKGERTSVPGKYNNEVVGGDTVEDLQDPVYEGQIIADFQGV